MCIGPPEDLTHRQTRQVTLVPSATKCFKKTRERRADGKSAIPAAEGSVDAGPGILRAFFDRPGMHLGPFAGASMMGIRPAKNLFHAQWPFAGHNSSRDYRRRDPKSRQDCSGGMLRSGVFRCCTSLVDSLSIQRHVITTSRCKNLFTLEVAVHGPAGSSAGTGWLLSVARALTTAIIK